MRKVIILHTYIYAKLNTYTATLDAKANGCEGIQKK